AARRKERTSEASRAMNRRCYPPTPPGQEVDVGAGHTFTMAHGAGVIHAIVAGRMRRLLPLLAAIVATACAEAPREPDRVAPDDEPVAPGIFAGPGEPIPSATPAQKEAFARGLALARRTFSPAEGLGPELGATSCLACHERPGPGGGAARFRSFLVGDDL